MIPKGPCGAHETECQFGCCPYEGWFCCPDGIYCATTADDCLSIAKNLSIIVNKSEKLVKMIAKGPCEDGETVCAGGCCPAGGWICCPDDMFCAENLAECPPHAKI